MNGRPWTPAEDLAILTRRSPEELAEILDRTVASIIQRRRLVRPVVPGLCLCCGGTPPTWTPDKIAEAIVDWHEQHGHPPSRDDWRHATYEHPSISTVDRVFGTLARATLAAGLTPRRPGPAKYWTRDRIIRAIQTWAMKNSGPPRKKDWRQGSPEHPVPETVVAEFGGWNVAIEEAGFFPRGRWGHRYTNSERTKKLAA